MNSIKNSIAVVGGVMNIDGENSGRRVSKEYDSMTIMPLQHVYKESSKLSLWLRNLS